MKYNMKEIERIHNELEYGNPDTLSENEVFLYMSYCFGVPLETLEARYEKIKGGDLMECPDFGE